MFYLHADITIATKKRITIIFMFFLPFFGKLINKILDCTILSNKSELIASVRDGRLSLCYVRQPFSISVKNLKENV